MSKVVLGIEHLFNDLGEVREEYARDEDVIGQKNPSVWGEIFLVDISWWFVQAMMIQSFFWIARVISDYDINPIYPMLVV